MRDIWGLGQSFGNPAAHCPAFMSLTKGRPPEEQQQNGKRSGTLLLAEQAPSTPCSWLCKQAVLEPAALSQHLSEHPAVCLENARRPDVEGGPQLIAHCAPGTGKLD